MTQITMFEPPRALLIVEGKTLVAGLRVTKCAPKQVVVVSLESRGLSVDWEDDSKALQCSLFFPAKVFHDLKVQIRQQMATTYGRLLDAALLLSASSGAAIKLEYPGPEGSLVVSQAQVHVGLSVPLLHSSLAPLSAPQPSPLSDLWTEPSCAFVCPGHLLREALEDLEALAAPIRLELRGEAEGVMLEARAPEARAGVELPRSVLRAWEGAERAPAHEYRARHLQLALGHVPSAEAAGVSTKVAVDARGLLRVTHLVPPADSFRAPASFAAAYAHVDAAGGVLTAQYLVLPLARVEEVLNLLIWRFAMRHFTNIVLGGGVSSGYFAREWVKNKGPRNSLAIISGDKYVSYERPALTKGYLFPKNPARLPKFHTCVGGGGELQTPSWYEEHGIEFLTETTIKEADLAKKTLTSDKGVVFTYDKLVIATGARPTKLEDFKMSGSSLQGVAYMRDVEDADRLLESVARAKAGSQRAVIIGGGYIGMEVGAGLSEHDLEVTLVFPESRLMERLLTPKLASFYEAYYADKGVSLRKGETVKEVLSEDGVVVTGVRLSDDSQMKADLVVVGIGARANTELFQDQLKMMDKMGGIRVGPQLQTSASDVYAMGDVAAFDNGEAGWMRQEHVANARLMGQFVAAQLLGKARDKAYSYLPFFYSREFTLSWQFYGQSSGEAVHWEQEKGKKFGAYWVDGGRVVGAFLEGGQPEENAAIAKAVESKAKVESTASLEEQGLGFAQNLA